MADDLTWKQRALYDLMSDISEECYCAGWMAGTEFVLWSMVADPAGPREWGQSAVTDQQVADMREIATEIGGWIRWHDDEDDPGLPIDEWGPRFEPMAQWLERVAADQQARESWVKNHGR